MARNFTAGAVNTAPAFLVDLRKYLGQEAWERISRAEERVLKGWVKKGEYLKFYAELDCSRAAALAAMEKAGMKIGTDTPKQWARADEVFSKVYREIRNRKRSRSTKAYAKKSTARNRRHKKKTGEALDWRVRFVEEYRKHGSKVRAAEAVKKKLAKIYEALDKQSDFFDQEFAAMMREEEVRSLSEIEDNLIERGKTDSHTAKFILSNLMPEKYKPEKLGQTGVNVFWFDAPGSVQAKNFMENLFGDRTSPLLLASEEDDAATPDA